MKKEIIKAIIAVVLILVFVASGLWMMGKYEKNEAAHAQAMESVQQEQAKLDYAAAEALEGEAAALNSESDTMETQLQTILGENETLDADTAALQQEYEEAAAQEDAVYYRTILESLREGMEQVEKLISGN